MRALVIDNSTRSQISAVVKFAHSHRIGLIEHRRIAAKVSPCAGDREGHICTIPDGFRVVFSIEEQPKGWTQHISISVDANRKMPNPAAIQEIIRQFGFKKDLKDCDAFWVEPVENPRAVNVMEFI